jgi:HSP20 family protein
MANRDLTPMSGGRGMAPFGRDPFSSFRREMDRLFEDFLAPAESRSFAGAGMATWPSLDVRETDQAYMVTAELPGLEQKDIELNLRDNVLTISGEKRQEKSDGDNGRSYVERTYGRFERVVPLGSDVDADRVEATFKNGILTVTVPKSAQARDKSKRIEIRPQ